MSQAERRVAQLRIFVGPQLLLDVLRVHVCTSAKSSPKAARNFVTGYAPISKTVSPAKHNADGAVICHPVTPTSSEKGFGQGFNGNADNSEKNASSTTATTKEPLERCVGACMRMLQAMLRAELLRSPCAIMSESPLARAALVGETFETGIGAGGGGGSLHRESFPLTTDPFSQMPFLEGGFVDSIMEVDSSAIVGGGGNALDVEDGDGAGCGGGRGTGLDAAVVCLQECQSVELQRGLLDVLLGLRDEASAPLRRELLRCVFISSERGSPSAQVALFFRFLSILLSSVRLKGTQMFFYIPRHLASLQKQSAAG